MNTTKTNTELTFTTHEAKLLAQVMRTMPLSPNSCFKFPTELADAVIADHAAGKTGGAWPAYCRLVCQLPAVSAGGAVFLYAIARRFRNSGRPPSAKSVYSALASHSFIRITREKTRKISTPLSSA